MSTYLVLKWLHIVSAMVLFGTGLGIAFFQWFVYRSGNVDAVAAVTRLVVRADFVFTAPAVIVQFVSGLLLMHAMALPWETGWISLSFVLYALVGACWLSVVVIQIRLARLAAQSSKGGTALPAAFHRAMRVWFWLGWPAFIGVLVILWLMVKKPINWSS